MCADLSKVQSTFSLRDENKDRPAKKTGQTGGQVNTHTNRQASLHLAGVSLVTSGYYKNLTWKKVVTNGKKGFIQFMICHGQINIKTARPSFAFNLCFKNF